MNLKKSKNWTFTPKSLKKLYVNDIVQEKINVTMSSEEQLIDAEKQQLILSSHKTERKMTKSLTQHFCDLLQRFNRAFSSCV